MKIVRVSNSSVNSPSFQREVERIKSLGGDVRVEGTTILVDTKGIIPKSVGEAFCKRLKKIIPSFEIVLM